MSLAFNIFEMFGKISADNKPANDAIDETTGKAKESSAIFSKIGGGLKVVGAGMAVAAGVAGAAAVGLSKKVISAYADYEQLVGGVDTLFKDASATVQKYADNAFKTAGMSANEYMETITGFSASLIQSLGGDTKKAAEVGNQAVTDMSDNANKMGTDISSIQNAYQGFAKQNYTMLDNLKLGYGGTQEEMQRLLTDAEKISGVKYDMSSFADVTEAIHVMQTQMGITGTTAKEAADTISGSIAGMSSAWSNLLTGMGNKNADIGKLVDDLVGQFSNVVKNITPVLGNIVNALPEVAAGLVGALGNLAPGLIQAALSLFTKVFQVMITSIPGILSSASGILLDAGKQLLQFFGLGISDGFESSFGKIFDKMGPLIFESLNTVLGQLPGLFESVIGAVLPIIEKVMQAFSKMDFSGIQSLISNILPAIQAGFETLMNIVEPAIEGVVDSFVKMWNVSQPLIEVLSGALMPAFQVIGAFLGGVFKGILMGVGAAFDAIGMAIQILTPVVSWIVDLFKSFAPVLTVLAEWIGVAIGMFANMGSAGNGLSSILKSAWDNIKTAVSTAGTLIKSAIDGIKGVFTALGSSGNVLSSIMGSIWNAIKSAISIAGNVIKSILSAIGTSFGSLGNTFSSIGSKISGIINGVKSTIQGLANIDISGAGAAIMNGFLGGLKSAYEKVKDFVGGIASWIKEHKGPIEYDRKLLVPAGNAIMTGLDESLRERFKGVKATVSSMANEMQNDFVLGNSTNLLNSAKFAGENYTNGSQQRNSDTESTNNLLQIIVEILYQILDKDPDIILDGDSVVEKLKKKIATALEELNDQAAGKKGFRRGMSY